MYGIFLGAGWGVQIFDLTDPILLPLAPTITGIIADFLQSIAWELYVQTLHNCDNIDTEVSPEYSVSKQCEPLDISDNATAKSIRQVPTIPYQYVSTIAHRWAAKLSITPLEICQNLQSSIRSTQIDSEGLEWDCWYNAAGYLYFQLTPASIWTWLDYIRDLPLALAGDSKVLPAQFHTSRLDREATSLYSSVSIAVYAHARCCSVLTLARRERLVEIADNWQMSTPEWWLGLRLERFPSGAKMPPDRSAEDRLIQALMRVLDGIYDRNSIVGKPTNLTGTFGQQQAPTSKQDLDWLKLTLDLAHNWLEFYRHCRIFGDLPDRNPHLAIARCGLTAISRRYLQVLLENYLGISALVEL